MLPVGPGTEHTGAFFYAVIVRYIPAMTSLRSSATCYCPHEWRDAECYVKKIIPRLRAVKVREIAQALQVSEPYAALIRSGRRRAHPRHWFNSSISPRKRGWQDLWAVMRITSRTP
jgi:hypothetical protein